MGPGSFNGSDQSLQVSSGSSVFPDLVLSHSSVPLGTSAFQSALPHLEGAPAS